MREWGINEKDWNLIHQLAREAGLSLALLYTSGRIVNLPWLDALEEDMSGVMVSLDSNALDDMLLSTLEGFLSPRSGRRKGYEVYGLCLGMTKCKQIKKTGRGMREEKHIHIHRAVPQLSAEGDFLSVEWREKSIEALLSASGALFPHYSIIADWHSHPYDAIEHLVARRGYLPSESDEMDNMRWFEHMQQQGEKPEVSFVLAIARTRNRPRSNRFRGEENTLQLHVGGCRIIISANRILQSGQYSSKNIQLSIPGLVS